MIEQLAALLEEARPQGTLHNQDLIFADLLARAARSCRDAGQRLILLVDGLDEDFALTLTSGGHSVVALLPAAPPAGMRVVVASRPTPALRGHLRDGHPLLDPLTVRTLERSPQAAAAEQDMQRELDELLRGHPAGRDLLGLLAVAGGGLSAADLAALAGLPADEVAGYLTTAAGRSVRSVPSRWSPAAGRHGYALGHEQLAEFVKRRLDPADLAERRDRLARWAEDYRVRRWPAETPEYLLRPYAQMLHGIKDLSHLVADAADRFRHDRMLAVTGSDAEAMQEIAEAMDIVVTSPEPDVAALGRLAVHHSRLTERSSNFPVKLPGAWALLGEYGRAEALADSIPDPSVRGRALIEVARATAVAGDHARALRVADSIGDPEMRGLAVQRIVVAIAPHAPALAEEIAERLTEPYRKGRALGAVAKAVGSTGDHARTVAFVERVVALAQSVPEAKWRHHAIIDVASALVSAGDAEGALGVVREQVDDDLLRLMTLASLAEVLAHAGQAGMAVSLAGEVEQLAAAQEHPMMVRPLVTRTFAVAGELTRARGMIPASSPADEAAELADLAVSVGRCGMQAVAERLIAEAKTAATSIGSVRRYDLARARAGAAVARAAAALGDFGEALVTAKGIPQAERRLAVLVDIAMTATAAADQGAARAVLLEVEGAARSMRNWRRDTRRLASLSTELIEVGDSSRADSLAGLVDEARLRDRSADEGRYDTRRSWGIRTAKIKPMLDGVAGRHRGVYSLETADRREDALAAVAAAVAEAGEIDRAENIIGLIVGEEQRKLAAIRLAKVLAQAGEFDTAVARVGGIGGSPQRCRGFGVLAQVAARRGDTRRVDALIKEIVDPDVLSAAQADLALLAAEAGEQVRAHGLAMSIPDRPIRMRVLAHLAVVAAESGDNDHAELLVGLIRRTIHHAPALAEVVAVFVEGGHLDRAEALAASDLLDPSIRHAVVRPLIEAFVKAGELARAEVLARLIPKAEQQAEALAVIALEAPPPIAVPLIAEAFRLGDWSVPLRAAAAISPAVLAAVADEHLRLAEDED
ncbi:hypothetical protein [Actinoplanes sp. DH11]|uniref:hypothetical protein n=1 Tax=Actinoplanes sp. DH11 TaxID=2857011 RepID=UPI001E2EDFFB|nr:hypothetical protein [Actinoplanes sp. DH11]